MHWGRTLSMHVFLWLHYVWLTLQPPLPTPILSCFLFYSLLSYVSLSFLLCRFLKMYKMVTSIYIYIAKTILNVYTVQNIINIEKRLQTLQM